MSIGEVLRAAGWRQGDLLDPEHNVAVAASSHLDIADLDRVVVITQSCDLLQKNDAAEPEVELLIIRRIGEVSGNFNHNKHPRILHIQSHTSGGQLAYSATHQDKVRLPRSIMLALKKCADEFLDDHQISTLTRWLSARYVRAAFPDQFEELLRTVKDHEGKLRKKARKMSAGVTGVFLHLHPFRDLNDGEKYSAELLALVHAGQSEHAPDIVASVEAIASLFRAAGIDVRSTIRPEDKVPYSIFRNEFKPWDFDSISISENPAQALPI